MIQYQNDIFSESRTSKKVYLFERAIVPLDGMLVA